MNVRDLVFGARMRLRRARGKPANPLYDFDSAQADPGSPDLPPANSDLARIFFSHTGRPIHKWVHYLDLYDRHFGPYRSSKPTFMEIGVQNGGSMEMWRRYFGDEAVIFGIDVDPACANNVSPPNQVRIGSQADPAFLKSVLAEMGRPDIVLDDGSHIARHQRESFRVLFPALKEGGLYVIEDTHTAYWPGSHEGGLRRKGTAIEFVKRMVDDMHAWYHRGATLTSAKTEVGGIHFYDSIIFIEKQRRTAPVHTKVSLPRAERDPG